MDRLSQLPLEVLVRIHNFNVRFVDSEDPKKRIYEVWCLEEFSLFTNFLVNKKLNSSLMPDDPACERDFTELR